LALGPRQKGFFVYAPIGAEIVISFLPVHPMPLSITDSVFASYPARSCFRLRAVAINPARRSPHSAACRMRPTQFEISSRRRCRFRIDGMHHQVHNFGDLGLERLGFGGVSVVVFMACSLNSKQFVEAPI